MKNFLRFVVIFFTVLGCDSTSKTEKKIAKIPIDLEVVRFDKIFAESTVEDLPELKSKYPQFFPERFHDSIWQQRYQDTLQQQLNVEVLKAFPAENDLEENLHALFQHIKYYFSEFEIPIVYTVTSDVDYRTKIIAADVMLIVELDNYLGESHFFYDGIPRYITKNMKPSSIIPEVATAYTRSFMLPLRQRTLLAQMIFYGKELYLKDLWLPDTDDALKIGYTEDEMLWAKENEIEIWRYFVEKELLFSTQQDLEKRFIKPAPFSKFNLDIDNESPGMIGRYMGWQIIKSYVENNDISLQQLILKTPEEIFNNSKYKPKK